MKRFETDTEKMITSFPYHDLTFKELEFKSDKLVLSIQDGSAETKVCLEGVKYLEIKELIPKGIVLSCYSFPISQCPDHLKEVVNFNGLFQYVEDKDINIFYADGTMGFEIIVGYSNGYSIVGVR